MLERLENLSALYANPHRFMNLAARLHARSGWRPWAPSLLACLWLAVCPMITSKGNGTHYVCACAGGVDGAFCL